MKKVKSNDEKFLLSIFEKYQTAKIMISKNHLKTSKTSSLQEKLIFYGTNNEIINYQKHLQTVDIALALLPKTEYTLIIKTFLTKNNKNWWKKFYSYQEYEKLYHKALSRFLYLYLI